MVKFKLHNIGLIKNTEIELNELTIVCGENNTGKTYITYSIYGFLSTWAELVSFEIYKNCFDELYENGFCTIDIKIYENNISDILKKLSQRYTETLGNIFSIEDEWFKDSSFEVQIQDYKFLNVELNQTLTSPSKKDVLQINKKSDSTIVEISTLGSDSNKHLPDFILSQGINRALGAIFFGGYFTNPFIITSERTGISLFYKELDINKNVMVEHITKNKGKDIDPFKIFEETISRYAMPIKDNIDYTRELGSKVCKQKSFLHGDRNITKYFSDMLNGSYKVVNKEVHFITKANKRKDVEAKQLPMYFSSSASKSLLELYFYIKHSAKKGDLLMIDEPELNLHPDNHIIMTRLLTYLSNNGINIFMTTHSDYMIKEFNNLIRFKHKILNVEKIHKDYGYKDYDKLEYEKLNAYINDFGELQPVDIDDMGLEVKSFDKTINRLSSAMDDIYFNIEE